MFTRLSLQTPRGVHSVFLWLVVGVLVFFGFAPGPAVGSAAAQTAKPVAAEDETTLVPGFKASEPYGWLSGDDTYQLSAEWLRLLGDTPEKHSARILASIDQASFANYAMFVTPIFEDPNHGLLSQAERELIGVVVSSANACVTCLIVHEQKLGKAIGDHSRARRIAVNYRTVALSAQERAMADFAVKLTEQPGKLEPADVQTLREVGLSEAEIFYVIEIAATYNLSNRVMSAYGMRPDDEFMAQIAPPD